MNPWISLMALYGIPGAFQIWQEWSNKLEPTEADWQKLLAMAQKPTAQYVEEAKAILAAQPKG